MAREVSGAVLLGVAALVVIVVLIFGGWRLGWWFKVENAKRQGQIENITSHNIRKGYDYQQTLRGKITSDIQGIVEIQPQIESVPRSEQGTLKEQRLSQLGTLCHDATEVSGEPLAQDQEQFIAQNCVAGAVSPSSTYARE